MWEGAEDRTKLQHIDPHPIGHNRFFPVLLGCSTGGLGALSPLLFSLPHLVSDSSGLQTHWLPVSTKLYNSSIAHSISLEWHVWSSSCRNNCHAVHRSLSSEASVYDCTMGCPRGVMAKAMHCGIVVREFVLQSRYYVHFRANTLGKGMNPLILPAMG